MPGGHQHYVFFHGITPAEAGVWPSGDKAALVKHHDMLVTVRDRVHALKAAGKSKDEAVAAKPTADLDSTWGKGSINGDLFTTLVYTTL